MAIRDFQSYMNPVLDVLGDGEERSVRATIDAVGDRTGIGPDDLLEMLPSGRQPLFYNRVSWAITFLSKAALIERTRRGHIRIQERGRAALTANATVRMKYLEQFGEYQEFRRRDTVRVDAGAVPDSGSNHELDPREAIERAERALRDSLADDVLDRLRTIAPTSFENVVVDLLVAIYGGSGERVGRAGDGGIDGVVKQDRLGLDHVYVQAKRWAGSVGGDEIRKFAGGLEMQFARKGVFMTTSHFTAQAKVFADRSDKRIVLVDGPELARLMIEHRIGVRDEATFVIRAIDNDYFDSV